MCFLLHTLCMQLVSTFAISKQHDQTQKYELADWTRAIVYNPNV